MVKNKPIQVKLQKPRDYQGIVNALNHLKDNLTSNHETKQAEANKAVGIGLIALGNIAMAGLYFGEAFGGFEFTLSRAFAGFIVLSTLYFVGYQFIKNR